MKEYKFRVLIDTLEEENAFRDIVVDSSSNFETLHKSVVDAFNFRGDQVASFYLSNDDWDKGQEIGLMDMTGESADFLEMRETTIEDQVDEVGQKLLYVYDFLSMWCFFLELVEVNEFDGSKEYPAITLEYGEAPAEESKQLIIDDSLDEAEEESDYNEFEDEFNNFDNIDNYDF
ncbi:MAG: hypothetical protein ABF242_03780 [Flavobacteriales bacterium]